MAKLNQETIVLTLSREEYDAFKKYQAEASPFRKEYMKQYFHELTKAELDDLIKQKRSYEYIYNTYKQPVWCERKAALDGALGCWELVGILFSKKNIAEICKTCPHYAKTH